MGVDYTTIVGVVDGEVKTQAAPHAGLDLQRVKTRGDVCDDIAFDEHAVPIDLGVVVAAPANVGDGQGGTFAVVAGRPLEGNVDGQVIKVGLLEALGQGQGVADEGGGFHLPRGGGQAHASLTIQRQRRDDLARKGDLRVCRSRQAQQDQQQQSHGFSWPWMTHHWSPSLWRVKVWGVVTGMVGSSCPSMVSVPSVTKLSELDSPLVKTLTTYMRP